VAGGVVLAAVQGNGGPAGSVSGYDARTGARLWTRADLPGQPQLAVAAGRVLVYDDDQNVYPRPALWPVTALSPSTGRTLWQSASAGPITALSAGPSGVAVTTLNPVRLELIDPVTGRVRWNVPAATGESPPLDTGTDLLYLGGAPGGQAGLVDLRAADGVVRWVAPVPLSWTPRTASPAPSAQVVLPAGAAVASGPLLRFGGDVVAAGSAMPSGTPGALSAFRLSDGAAAWSATVPTLVQVPPAVAGSDLLVQPTDPSLACAATGAVSAVGHAA
jgi:outer membrane protein assembly factor BamB